MNEAMQELLTNPRFAAVLDKCLEEEELITQFERLTGITRPPARRSPIEVMVDKATGFAQDQWEAFFTEFIPFVYRYIWLTWPERNNQECWE
ncbi:hypothetical protein [Dryocola clanedunensis]